MYPSLLAHATDAKERLVAEHVRTAGARACAKICSSGCSRRSIKSTRSPRWTSSLRPRRRDAAPTDPRLRRLVAHRSRDLPADVGGRAVRRRRPAGEPLRAQPAGIRDAPYRAAGCSWDQPFDEVSPFGSSERHVLRTGRGVCVRGRIVGSIVVRVMLDYRTLPFISSQSPYLESLRPNRQVTPEGVSGPRRRVRRSTAGAARRSSSRAPASGRCPDAVFQRAGRIARTVLGVARARRRDVPRLFPQRSRRHLRARLSGDHLARPPDQPRGAGDAGARALRRAARAASTLFSALDAARRRRAAARCCAKCDPVSTASCSSPSGAGAVVPVFILAIFTRTYVATQLVAGAEEAAARDRDDGAAAGRGLRRAAAARRRGARRDRRSDHGAGAARDRRGRQPVRSHAPAGDQRARSLRVAAAVDADAGRRLPRASCSIGCRPTSARRRSASFAYRLAAAPVRASGREGIVTVPLTQPAAGNRAADRRARSPRALGGSCCSACSAPRSATGWRSGSPIRSTG